MRIGTFWCKNIGCFEIYGVSARTRGVSQGGHFRTWGRGVNFSQFCAATLYGRPLRNCLIGLINSRTCPVQKRFANQGPFLLAAEEIEPAGICLREFLGQSCRLASFNNRLQTRPFVRTNDELRPGKLFRDVFLTSCDRIQPVP